MATRRSIGRPNWAWFGQVSRVLLADRCCCTGCEVLASSRRPLPTSTQRRQQYFGGRPAELNGRFTVSPFCGLSVSWSGACPHPARPNVFVCTYDAPCTYRYIGTYMGGRPGALVWMNARMLTSAGAGGLGSIHAPCRCTYILERAPDSRVHRRDDCVLSQELRVLK